MLIAINLKSENEIRSKFNISFILDLFKIIISNHPQQQFVIISNTAENNIFSNYTNVQYKQINVSKNIFRKFIYSIKCKKILKKLDAKVVIQFDSFLKNYDALPQILFYDFHTKLNFQKKNQKNFIVTTSKVVKNKLISTYQIPEKNIDFIYLGYNPNLHPFTHNEIEQIKDGYADGRNYFLFISGFHLPINFMNALKAFSLFKKRQLSNMKLVVVDNENKITKLEKEKLDTYKHKDDVVFVESANETQLNKLIAAAYAVLFPGFQNDNYNYLIKTLQNKTSIITSELNIFKEITGEAAFYVNPSDINSIANGMQEVYKNEELRKQKIELGLIHLQQFNAEVASKKMWSIIENCAH